MDTTDEMTRKILGTLKKLEKSDGQVSHLVEFYCELFHIQRKAKSNAVIAKPKVHEYLVRARLREGIPLLVFEDFRPDWDQVQSVCRQIIAWTSTDPEGSSHEEENLRKFAANLRELRGSSEAWYRGVSLKTFAVAQNIDPEILTSVVGAALKPFLSAYSSLLLPEVDQELWRRKYCPVCGGKPDFSFLKEGGTRWLFCSRCDGKWLFSRIECPYCGNRNQESLAYFTTQEHSDRYRLYVCEECRTYIKAIDLRAADSDVLLPLERVLTVDLDRQGRENGYEPG